MKPRVRALDGLRGVAALVVVVYHVLLASSAPLSQALARPNGPHLTPLLYALAYTPLRIVWAGPEWVIVFFVLSGFVLTLAVSGSNRFDAWFYYPSRFVRLYVPVWGALVVAAAAHTLVAHNAVPSATGWLNLHAVPFTVSALGHEGTLVFGAGDRWFTTVLWSLHWEVIFSLLLPLFVVAARANPLVAGSIALALTTLGLHSGWLHFLPTFMLGCAMAFEADRIRSLFSKRRVWMVGLPAAVALLTADAWLRSGAGEVIALPLEAAGAAAFVALALAANPFGAALCKKPLQLLGKRSFTLYLVHEPLLVAVAFLLGGAPPVSLAVVAFPLIVLVTEAFFRTVERPSHVWARWAGTTVSELAQPRTRFGTEHAG